MPDAINITVDISGVENKLERIAANLRDGKDVLRQFYVGWFKPVMSHEWEKVRAPGGTFRGQAWAGMADQYTRKTDGVTVPAWGGVPKVKLTREHIGFYLRKKSIWGGAWTNLSRGAPMMRITGAVKGTGTVLGRKRNANKGSAASRVNITSVMNQDIGNLRDSILAEEPDIRNNVLTIGGSPVIYAEHVLVDYNRNPLFFAPEDEAELGAMANEYVQSVIDRYRAFQKYTIPDRFLNP